MKTFLFIKKNSVLIFNKNTRIVNFCIEEKNIIKSYNFKNIQTFYTMKKKIQECFISNLRGFFYILELIGLGFSVTIKNNLLRFNVGFNHSIFYFIPKDVLIRSKRKTLFIFSNSFFILKQVIIDLKNFRKLSIYKLKGIKEKNELYIKKN